MEGVFSDRKSKFLLKAIDKRQFDLKNNDFYGFLVVLTRVLFENVVAMDTRKSLCYHSDFRISHIHIWEKPQRFKKKYLTVPDRSIENPARKAKIT